MTLRLLKFQTSEEMLASLGFRPWGGEGGRASHFHTKCTEHWVQNGGSMFCTDPSPIAISVPLTVTA